MEPQKRQTKETDKSNNKLNCRRRMWCSNYAWIPRKQIWGGSDDEITTLLSTTANHKSHHTNWYSSKTPNGCNVQFITRPRACKKLKSCGLGAFGSSKSASALGKDQNSWVVMLKRRHHKFYIKNGHFTAWITWSLVESGQSYQHLEVVFILCSDKAYGTNVHPAFFSDNHNAISRSIPSLLQKWFCVVQYSIGLVAAAFLNHKCCFRCFESHM